MLRETLGAIHGLVSGLQNCPGESGALHEIHVDRGGADGLRDARRLSGRTPNENEVNAVQEQANGSAPETAAPVPRMGSAVHLIDAMTVERCMSMS